MKIGYAIFFYLLCFLPYLRVFPIPTDIQPNALLFSAIFFFSIKRLYFNKTAIVLLIISTLACLLFFKSISFTSVRSLFGYVGFFLISATSYHFTKKTEISFELLLGILISYLLISIIQMYVDSEIVHFLLSREHSMSQSQGRGVESLTAEPTFYGFLLLLIVPFVLVGDFTRRQTFFLLGLIVLQLFIFSKSASAIGSLIISCSIILIFYVKQATLVAIIFSAIAGFIFFFNPELVEESRAYKILSLLYEKGFIELTQKDPSARGRLYHIFFSIYGAFENYFIPQGFDTFEYYMDQKRLEFSFLRWEWVKYDHGRILSFIGSLLFEMGILGFLIIYMFFKHIWTAALSLKKKVFLFTFFIVILLQAIPVNMPLIPLFFGAILNKQKDAKTN